MGEYVEHVHSVSCLHLNLPLALTCCLAEILKSEIRQPSAVQIEDAI